jgi:hypothetical protein
MMILSFWKAYGKGREGSSLLPYWCCICRRLREGWHEFHNLSDPSLDVKDMRG